MKNLASKISIWKLMVAIVFVALLSLLILGDVKGETPLAGIMKMIIPQGDVIVAYVNDQPIDLGSLEKMKSILQSNQPELSTEQAYRDAIQELIRQKAWVVEAKQRGIIVSTEEAKAYRDQMKSLASESPEIAEVLKEQEKSFAGSEAQLENKIIAIYQDALAVEKLSQMIMQEAPQPTEDEIRAALAIAPAPNQLVLIPMEFTNIKQARETFAELEKQKPSETTATFEETFTSYVKKLVNLQPNEFLHKEFFFREISELPDYAQSAVHIPENSIGIYERENGTAVIYLVLKSVILTDDEVRNQIRNLLWQDKQSSYLLKFEENLIQHAQVKYMTANLPAEVRIALTGK
jgi:hypothetical protein